MFARINQGLVTATGGLFRLLKHVARGLRPVLAAVLGSWQAPRWLAWVGRKALPLVMWLQQRLLWLLAAAAVAWGGAWAYPQAVKWWHGLTPDRVQPTRASARITAPLVTDYEREGRPNPVLVAFSASAAPLALVGKEATGVTLLPPHPGRWQWTSASGMEFAPSQDWPVGQDYTVEIAGSAVAANIELTTEKLKFQSAGFTARFDNAEFYQDPVSAQIRRAVYQLRFSHPIVPAELEKRLLLTYDAACKDGMFSLSKCASEKFTITYDKLKLQASIQSEPLAIPEKARELQLRLGAGLSPARGGSGAAELARSVGVPGLYGLTVASIDAQIVSNEAGEPEHVLMVAAGMPVHERELARAVSAWMLPIKNKADDAEERFDWSQDPNAVTEAVLKRSIKLELPAIANEREVEAALSFKVPRAEGGRYVLVRVAKGLKTPGGYQLGENAQNLLRLKTFAPEIAIMSKGSLLALSGEKKLPILVRDLPGMQLEIGRLLPQQLQHLVSQSQGEFGKPEFNRGVTADNLTERFLKTVTFKLTPGKSHFETVDFGEYLKSDASDRRGVFLLSVRGFDPKAKVPAAAEGALASAENGGEGAQQNEGDGEGSGEGGGDEAQARAEAMGRVDQRLVLVTDLGLVAKKNMDGSRNVFVQSIATGAPVAGAVVEVWGRNGSVIAQQVTDANGQALLPTVGAFMRDKAPVLLAVRKAGDLSFLPFNRSDRTLDVSRFDVGGLKSAGVPNQMTAYVFSDRGIYRPGDTMNLGLIVKAASWRAGLADLPVELEITDARGLRVRRDKLRLGPSGAAEVAHATAETDPTGNYTVNVYLPREAAPGAPEVPGLLLGSTVVKVQEFMPDRSKVVVKLSAEAREGWVAPKDLKALVDVQNLFGTPAPARRVEAALTLSPAYPSFKSHPDYSFYDPKRPKDTVREDLSATQTSDKGAAEFDLQLGRFAAATYQVHVLAKAFEPEGGRSVQAEAQTLVSDLAYLVGVKTDGDTGYINRNAARTLSVIAVDSSAKKIAVPGLRLERLERKVLSVLVKQNNGLFRYESRKKEVVLEDKPFAVAATGVNLPLNTAAPGQFAYVLRDAQGVELNRLEYSVVGAANLTRSLDRNAELQLSLNKKDYAPGEEIEINVRAPYTGAGLITIERDRVYHHTWFKTDKTASVQKITLPKEFEGSGYVSVHFVRDLASDEVYMSPLSHGVVPFATSLAQRTAKVTLESSALVKPGQAVKMTLKADKPTRAVVFAVDEGILQVARYKTPDPLKHFFQKRALEVGTLQSLDLILPEFKKLMQAAAPGGDAEGELGKHLNPFKRKRDKPVVFWSGWVDVSGSKEFSYTVPESFNGALRVMAVVVNEDATAGVSAKTTVRGDLIVLPNVPVAMAPGDTVDIGVGLANNILNSGKDVPISLNLSVTGGLEVVGQASQTLKINERGEQTTRFQVRAKPGAQAQLGSASVIFNAVYKTSSARLSTDVSVRPASPYVTLVQAGSLARGGELKAQADLYPNFRKSELAISTAPWAFATGLMAYLEQYPHGCTEQITSQTFPSVLLMSRPELARSLAKPDKAGNSPHNPNVALQKTFERYIVQLRTRQTADGGFALWPGSSTDPFATVYALHLLVEARERKMAVPQDMLTRVNDYLQGWLGQSENNEWSWRQRTQAAYLLTRQGILVPAALSNLRESWRTNTAAQRNNDLGAAYLAATFQLVKQDAIAQELLRPIWADLLERTAKNTQRGVWGRYYDPIVHDSMLLHLVARHFPAQMKTMPPAAWERMAALLRDGWYNSLSSASMILAVDAYADAVGTAATGNVTATAQDSQGARSDLSVGAFNPLSKTQVPASASQLRLANGSGFPLYYSWSEQGFERQVAQKAINQGLEIIHEVVNAKGEVVTQARLGEELTMRVRVRSLEREQLSSLAIVDVLPGGLEPVLSAASDGDDNKTPIWQRRLGGSGNWQVEYADIREDRVVFYGSVGRAVSEISYKVRATNTGQFVVPSAYGEAMYDRRVFARSAGGTFTVVANP